MGWAAGATLDEIQRRLESVQYGEIDLDDCLDIMLELTKAIRELQKDQK